MGKIKGKDMNEFINKLIAKLEQESKVVTTPIIEIECLKLSDAIDAVKSVAEECKLFGNSEQVDDGWIPCSERLPEKSGYYLMSVENYGSSDRDMITPIKEVWVRRFHKGIDGDKYQNIWQQMPYETFDVIAWQPLPAPYQKKGE